MRGPDGTLVLADLDPDGRLVAVTLTHGTFRAIAPGVCWVYGCTRPARRTVNGFPVCPQCQHELTP